MEKASLVVLFLGILAVTVVPTHGWVIPPNPAGEDNKYEIYGPHVNGIIIRIYADATSEWNAMAAGQLDLEDWELDSQHVTLWSNNTNGMVEANYGGDTGYYILDINNNATYAASESGPFVHNPTSESILRQAIAYCVNRSYAVSFTGGLAKPIYTPVPTYMTGCVNPSIAPGKPLQALTYSDLRNLPASAGNCDLEAANALLDANGYTIDGNGWRIDSLSQGGTGAELNLRFYSKGGDRRTMADDIKANLNAIHVKVDYYTHVTRWPYDAVYSQEYFNLFTGGWTAIGPDPDYLCDLYNGSNYYHPGYPPNYDGINYSNTNGNATIIKLAPTIAVGIQATLDFQVAFAEEAAAVPIWCYSGFKSFKNVPVEGGGNWTHIVNQEGIGVNSWWSTLDMQTNGNLYPNLNAWYGFSSTVTLQNIVYAQWYWDLEVLDRIYDVGAARDPYTLASWVPQLYKSWTVGTWNDPSAGGATKTSVTITLRPDVFWQDGQPFTAADVYYTLTEISKDLLAKGFPPPWWYPTVQYMRSVSIIDDYNIQILLDVQSVWAVGWVIGSVVIPKHIWKNIVDHSTVGSSNVRNVDATTPDPYIIGTGPFRWYSGVGSATGTNIVLVANSPGSSAPDPATGVTPALISPGYYFYNPIYVDVSPPNDLSKVNLANKNVLSTSVAINITLRNMDTHDSLTVNKYVYVNGVLQPGFPHDVTLAPMAVWNTTNPYPADPLGNANVETLTLTLAKKTLTYIKVAVHIKGPPTLGDPQTNPWISTWINATLPIWVTIPADIAGTNLYDVMTPVDSHYNMTLAQIPLNAGNQTVIKKEAPAPDLRVDGADIAFAALAFGSVPGSPNWSPVADVNHDYRVDGSDIALIALQFGY